MVLLVNSLTTPALAAPEHASLMQICILAFKHITYASYRKSFNQLGIKGPPYETVSLQNIYRQEQESLYYLNVFFRTRYFSPEERETYRLSVHEGALYDAQGNLFDTLKAETWHGSSLIKKSQLAIIVMDINGNFYASTLQRLGEVHHSSFWGNTPIAFAGEIEVINGKLTHLNNYSGHFRPSAFFLKQALHRLDGLGVDVSQVSFEQF